MSNWISQGQFSTTGTTISGEGASFAVSPGEQLLFGIAAQVNNLASGPSTATITLTAGSELGEASITLPVLNLTELESVVSGFLAAPILSDEFGNLPTVITVDYSIDSVGSPGDGSFSVTVTKK